MWAFISDTIPGVTIPSIIYLYQNLSPRVDINYWALSDWAQTQGLVQGFYQVWDALEGPVTREQAKGEITFTEYHRVEDIYIHVAQEHAVSLQTKAESYQDWHHTWGDKITIKLILERQVE